MNTDRRMMGQVCIALLHECNEIGLIADASHVAVTDALKHMQQAEYWQLRNQERHEGKNASTDSQLAICRIALPALEEALKAWNQDDFATTITQLTLAITTDGKRPRKNRKNRG